MNAIFAYEIAGPLACNQVLTFFGEREKNRAQL